MPMPSKTVSTSWTLFRECRKLTLEKFIDCLIHNDLNSLIISGNPPKAELENAWHKIYVEYIDLMQAGDEPSDIFQLIKEIQIMNARIVFVDGAVNHLFLQYDQPLVDMLVTVGFSSRLKETDDGDTQIRKLNNVVARAKKMLVDVKLKEAELEKMAEAAQAQGQITEAYFDEWLLTIQKEFNFGSAAMITVSQFVKAVRRITARAEQQELKAKTNGR